MGGRWRGWEASGPCLLVRQPSSIVNGHDGPAGPTRMRAAQVATATVKPATPLRLSCIMLAVGGRRKPRQGPSSPAAK